MQLFPIEHRFPSGFSYEENFLSLEEEADLITHIGNLDLHPFNFHGYEAKRKVATFGFDYNFDQKSLSPGKEIPAAFDQLVKKVAFKIDIPVDEIVELLVTEYPAGAVINWHRDAFPFEIIAGISLVSDCVFKLRPYQEEKRKRSSVISFEVKRRSLYVMRGSSRIDWQHSIAPVQALRYSVTMRTLMKRNQDERKK